MSAKAVKDESRPAPLRRKTPEAHGGLPVKGEGVSFTFFASASLSGDNARHARVCLYTGAYSRTRFISSCCPAGAMQSGEFL